MTVQHDMAWERDTSEWVDENNWVIREPTGATFVSCSCGFSRTVPDREVQRVIDEHLAEATRRP